MTSSSSKKPIIPEEDDLDDLDDLLSEFNPPTSILTSNHNATSSSALPLPSNSITSNSDDFPDPDSPILTGVEGNGIGDEDDLSAEIQAGLSQLLSGLGGGGTGDGDEELDFKKIMEELMKGDMDFSGMEGEEGLDDDPAALLAALSNFGGTGGTKGKNVSTTTTSNNYPTASTSTSTSTPTFQETIAQTMNKMKASSDTVTSETAAKEASELDPLAAMMAKMAGLDPNTLGGDEQGLQGMLDEMMNQLMSRELLYEPLKELSEKYPAYLAENASTLSEKDLTRYQKQKVIVEEIVAKFEEEGADAEGPLTDEQEAKKAARSLEIVELVGKMNDQGAPPKEIMGAMPPGMDGEGALGMPSMPDCPVS